MSECAYVEVGGRDLVAAKRVAGLPSVRGCGLGVAWVSVTGGVMRLSMLWLEGALVLRLGEVAAGQDRSVPVDLALLRPVLRAVRVGDVVTWRVDASGVSVSVRGRGASGPVESFLPVMENPADAPSEPDQRVGCDSPCVVVAGEELAGVFTRVARAASRDMTLPALCGVLFECEGERLNVVGTDRFRMVAVSMSATGGDVAASGVKAIVPRWPAVVLAAMSGAMTISLASLPTGGGRRIVFATDTCTVYAQAISAEYPRWQSLFSGAVARAGHGFTVADSGQLAESGEAARKAAGCKASPVRMSVDLDGGRLRLVVTDAADGAIVFDESVPVSVKGWDGPDLVAVRPEYLRDAARVFTGPVTVNMGSATNPVLLTQDDSRCLVMPVRLAV